MAKRKKITKGQTMIYTNKEYLPAITITQVLKLNTRLGVKSISVF
jgi:hypothetical protein